MTERAYIKKIKEMTAMELLNEILDSPTFMTDSYFKDIKEAIYKRHEELREEQKILVGGRLDVKV